MHIESDEGFVSLIADTEEEAKLLEALARAINVTDSSERAVFAATKYGGVLQSRIS